MNEQILANVMECSVNGRIAPLSGDRSGLLLDFLRNTLHLKGSRFGCGHERCCACMVLIDGQPSYSCTRSLESVVNCRIETIESLGLEHSLVRAFLDEQAGQCGYCLSGILMSAKGLLDRDPSPGRAQIIEALEPHLCRCGAHARIVRAVQRAAKLDGAA
jgi:nicotinate dehydrogenase subunit A